MSLFPFGFLLLCAASFPATLIAQKSVHYDLQFPNAAHHEVEVRATFSGITGPVLEVSMSRSSPGRYSLHEFAKNLYNFRAIDPAGHALSIVRMNTHRWNVMNCPGTVIIDYTLYGDRVDGTYDATDETHAHLNMPATLVWANGFEDSPASLTFTVPAGSKWQAATQLIPAGDGVWRAPNLEWLMDSPVELSQHDMPEWKVEDSVFRLALHHRGSKEEANNYARMCQAVVLEEEGVFGAFPKYAGGTYTFLVDYLPYAHGDGMEHRDSTVISSSQALSSSAAQLIQTVSHEFFHSWNVKRIRPHSLEPFNFEDTDMSGELWFAEGFTNYYGPLVLQRAGITRLSDFTASMSQAVNEVLNSPARNIFNVIDMSRQAPFVDAATANDPSNFVNTFLSYYIYGEALALGVDLAIREQFPGKSLDDWMRAMWREHPDIGAPYTLKDLKDTLAETTSPGFASDFFAEHIYGKEPMDYRVLLAPAGLLLEKAHPGRASLGPERLTFSESGVEIASNASQGSPLYRAGLDRTDKILKWNDKFFRTSGELDDWLASRHIGERIRVKAETRAGVRGVDVELTEDCSWRIVPYEESGETISQAIVQFRAAWLNSRALHALPKFVKEP